LRRHGGTDDDIVGWSHNASDRRRVDVGLRGKWGVP
jgi:hypothetical protein